MAQKTFSPFEFLVYGLRTALENIRLFILATITIGASIVGSVIVAAIIGLLGYALFFITLKNPSSLPRIVIGAFLVFASLLTRLFGPLVHQTFVDVL